MLRKVCTLALFSVAIGSAQAAGLADNDHKFCLIAGYAAGADDKQTVGLALQVLNRKGVPYDNLCQSTFRLGSETAQRIAHGAQASRLISTDDNEVMQLYMDFKVRIQNAILTAAGY